MIKIKESVRTCHSLEGPKHDDSVTWDPGTEKEHWERMKSEQSMQFSNNHLKRSKDHARKPSILEVKVGGGSRSAWAT